MKKNILSAVIAGLICGSVLAQIPPSVWGVIAAAERQAEKERQQNFYIGLGIAALVAALAYVIWKNKTSKKCPKCGELIRKEALICKHCGKTFESQEIR